MDKPDLDAKRMLDMLDGLSSRGLIDRVQIVTCDTVSVQLVPKPFTPTLTKEEELAREDAKVEPVDPQTLLLAASEGFA